MQTQEISQHAIYRQKLRNVISSVCRFEKTQVIMQFLVSNEALNFGFYWIRQVIEGKFLEVLIQFMFSERSFLVIILYNTLLGVICIRLKQWQHSLRK